MFSPKLDHSNEDRDFSRAVESAPHGQVIRLRSPPKFVLVSVPNLPVDERVITYASWIRSSRLPIAWTIKSSSLSV